MIRYYIGIDPGTNTGWAIWDKLTKTLTEVTSMKAVEAEAILLDIWKGREDFVVMVEDTRKLRLPRSKQEHGPSAMKGIGSVHRDMGRWEEFLTHHRMPFRMKPLSSNVLRKAKSDVFTKYTGWTARTNEHGRDAAAQVWGI